MSEWRGAMELIPGPSERYPTLELLWVDGRYATHMSQEGGEAAGVRLKVVPKEAGQTTSRVLRRRWVVGRTFAWLMRCRLGLRLPVTGFDGQVAELGSGDRRSVPLTDWVWTPPSGAPR